MQETTSYFDNNNDDLPPHAYDTAPFYAPSTFGGIHTFKANKRAKLNVQYDALKPLDPALLPPQIFKGLKFYVSAHPPS